MTLTESLLKFALFLTLSLGVLVLSSGVKINSLKSFFLNCALFSLLGIFFFTATYAVIITQFATTQTIALSLLALFWFLNKDHISFSAINWAEFQKKLPIMVLCAGLSFAHFEFWNHGLSFLEGYNVHQDTYFYSLISKSLSERGIENYYHHYADFCPELRKTTGYHFSEFWLNNALTKLVGFHWATNLQSFVYPFFTTMLMLSILGLAEEVGSKWSPYALVLAMVVVNGAFVGYSPLKAFLGGSVRGLFLSANHEFKFVLTYALVVFIFYFASLHKNVVNSAIFAVLLCTTSFLNVPVVGFLLFAFTGFVFFYQRKDLWKIMATNLLFLATLLMGLDLDLLEKAHAGDANPSFFPILRVSGLIASSLTSLAIVCGHAIIKTYKQTWKALLLPAFLLFSAALCYLITYHKHDSHQIFYSIQHSTLFLTVMFSLCLLDPKDAKIHILVFLTLKIIFTFRVFEQMPNSFYSFWRKNTQPISEQLKNTQKIAVFRSYESMRFENEKYQPHYKKPFIFFECYEVLFQNPQLEPISISDFEVFKNDGPFRESYIDFMKNGSALFSFAKTLLVEPSPQNADSIVFAFLRHHQIDKVLHKAETPLPEALKSLKTLKDENGNCLTIIDLSPKSPTEKD